jgi:excisionase family DNA binding protein
MQMCFDSTGNTLSVRHVAHYFRVPERTIRHWASTGVLRARKFGKLWNFDRSVIEISAKRLGRDIGTGTRGAYVI